jgi:CBS domain-containing protein
MTTAREIMSADIAFVRVDEPVKDAARKMADLDIGALPVCNDDRRLDGMITDRDIAVRVVAEGRDPRSTVVGDVRTLGEVVTIGADDSVELALETMQKHAVRRLPVVDGQQVVGMVSQGDIATNASREQTGEVVESISDAPPR